MLHNAFCGGRNDLFAAFMRCVSKDQIAKSGMARSFLLCVSWTLPSMCVLEKKTQNLKNFWQTK